MLQGAWTRRGSTRRPNVAEVLLAAGFTNSYNIAVGTLVGFVPQVNERYDYQVAGGGATATESPDGTTLDRHFEANKYEYYVQDSWRASRTLPRPMGCAVRLCRHPMKSMGKSDTRDQYIEAYILAADRKISCVHHRPNP